jgi:hypothetical protein
VDKRKGRPHKKNSQLPSEKKSSDDLLAHEDVDPSYPFDPVKDERGNTLYSEKQDPWKSDSKKKHKKN